MQVRKILNMTMFNAKEEKGYSNIRPIIMMGVLKPCEIPQNILLEKIFLLSVPRIDAPSWATVKQPNIILLQYGSGIISFGIY